MCSSEGQQRLHGREWAGEQEAGPNLACSLENPGVTLDPLAGGNGAAPAWRLWSSLGSARSQGTSQPPFPSQAPTSGWLFRGPPTIHSSSALNPIRKQPPALHLPTYSFPVACVPVDSRQDTLTVTSQTVLSKHHHYTGVSFSAPLVFRM